MEKFSNVVPATTLNTLQYSGKLAQADFVCNSLQEGGIYYNWTLSNVQYAFKVNATIQQERFMQSVCAKAVIEIQNYFLNPSDTNLIKVHAALRAA